MGELKKNHWISIGLSHVSSKIIHWYLLYLLDKIYNPLIIPQYPLDYLMLLDKIRQFQADPSWRGAVTSGFAWPHHARSATPWLRNKKNRVSGGSAPSKINLKLVDMVNHGKSRQ